MTYYIEDQIYIFSHDNEREKLKHIRATAACQPAKVQHTLIYSKLKLYNKLIVTIHSSVQDVIWK